MPLTAEERLNHQADELAKVTEEVKGLIQQQTTELKAFGKTTEETGKKFDDIDKRTNDAIHEIKSLKERFEELAQQLARPGVGGTEKNAEPLDFDLGRMLTESKSYKSCIEQGKFTGAGFNVEVPHFDALIEARTGGFSLKALTSLAASVGDAINPRRLPGFVAAPLAPTRLRNLIPAIPVTGPVEWVKETNFHQLYVLIDGESASGQKVVNVKNISGFYVGQTVTIAPGLGAQETHVLTAVSAAADPANQDYSGTITTTNNLANTHAIGIEVVSDAFIFTAETYLKPNAEITLDLITDTPKVLAHMVHASRQILDDVPQLQAFINMRLLDSFILSEEVQFLYGTNTGQQIRGILTETDINAYSWSSGTPGDTKMDALRRAHTLSMLAFYPVTGTVINPTDREDIDLAKGSDGHYLWSMAPGANGGNPWRVPLVETTAIRAGTALVGAFALGAAIYDRQMANIRVSEEFNNNFGRNMVTIRAEERVALAVYRPPAFTAVTFDSAPV